MLVLVVMHHTPRVAMVRLCVMWSGGVLCLSYLDFKFMVLLVLVLVFLLALVDTLISGACTCGILYGAIHHGLQWCGYV